MNKLILILTACFAFACGGIADTSDPDTHVFEQTIADFPDGTSVTTVKDLGFDRDAYLDAMADQDRINDLYWADVKSGPEGSTRAAVTISGRYGIDSQAGAFSTEQRCPNNPPYTGNAGINPNGNYCTVAFSKNNPYWVDASFNAYDLRFSGDANSRALSNIIINQMTSANSGTSWNNTSVGVFANARYLISNVAGAACGGAVACTTGLTSPIVLAQPTGLRTRKRMADGSGWFGKITFDIDAAYAQGWLSDSATTTQKTNAFGSMVKHEYGHMMGLGHRPHFGSDPSTNIMAGGGSTLPVAPFLADQKSELTNYIP